MNEEGDDEDEKIYNKENKLGLNNNLPISCRKSDRSSDNYKSLRSLSANVLTDANSDKTATRYKRNAITPDKISLASSRRSIVTTVEFYPPIEASIETFNLENEELERKTFFEEFKEKCEMLDKIERENLEIQSSLNETAQLLQDSKLSMTGSGVTIDNKSKSSLYESSIDSVINDSEDNYTEIGELENKLYLYPNENDMEKSNNDKHSLAADENNLKLKNSNNNDSLFTSINSNNEELMWEETLENKISTNNQSLMELHDNQSNNQYKSKSDQIIDEINEILMRKNIVNNKGESKITVNNHVDGKIEHEDKNDKIGEIEDPNKLNLTANLHHNNVEIIIEKLSDLCSKFIILKIK